MTYKYLSKSISKALYFALKEDAFYAEIERHVSNDPARNQEAMLKYFDYSMREGQRYGELYIPKDEVYGASIWSKPIDSALGKKISADKKAFLHRHMGESSLKKYTEIVQFMSENAKRVVAPGSWYLSIVGIEPKSQGQGLGAALIDPILKKADAAGKPSFLETFTHRNMSFYQRLEYREAASFFEPVTASDYWIMFREPS